MLSFQTYSQSIQRQDSIKIHFNQLTKATEALIELKYLKKESGYWQQRLHNKDVSLQFYERGYNKYMLSDSLNSILLVNKNSEIEIKDNSILDLKYQFKKEKRAKIVTAILTPLAAISGFLLGWYLK